MSESPRPLFAADELPRGPLLTLIEANRLIDGDDSSLTGLRDAVSRGRIYTRGRRDDPARQNPHLVSAADVAAYVAIAALFESGIRDGDAIGFVSAALYGWQPEQHSQAFHPIEFALWNADAGRGAAWWYLAVHRLRDREGQKRIRAFCYPDEDMPAFDPTAGGFLPVSTTTVPLTPLLRPFCLSLRAIDERAERTRLDA